MDRGRQAASDLFLAAARLSLGTPMDSSAPLPAGTVTFLFTDIEGSTGLWEREPDAMRLALARHDALLRAAIETNNGYVFKTVGDAFCAAFSTASDALDAALALQQSLRSIHLSTVAVASGVVLRVRVALHTGAAELREGDYFGPALNRVARLLAAAHGGQVLLSAVTQGLVQDELPPAASLKDLGSHRLRDLQRPEQVFQLLHPSLPADFPPLQSLDAMPNNLPQQVTSFIGREQEMAAVKQRLASARLVTLTGAGGSGKTRLSLQVAADVLDRYPDGVWLVELAPLSDPNRVLQTVATVLGVREEPDVPPIQALVRHLKPKRLLLTLDNCEHLLSACAELVATVLRHCPQATILASSREGLGIVGENLYRVPSLSLPDPEHLASGRADLLSSLTQYEAVRLFIDRATAVQPTFSVSDSNAPDVAEICHRLDGIPLAIELAAVRVRALPVEQIASRLDDRFRLLTGGSRTALPRQQTLRALIDWSHDLLSAPERILLRRLSVFAGGWALEAAEAVCRGDEIEAWEVLDLLTALVDKSLVLYEEPDTGEAGGGEARYRFLETVRQYSRERLLEAREVEAVRGRHLDFFLRLAEEAEPKLQGPEQVECLERLERELDNLRAALEWSEAAEGGTEAALRLVAATRWFWYLRYHRREGLQWLEQALARSTSEVTAVRAKALHEAALLSGPSGEPPEKGEAFYQESLAIYQKLGDQKGLALLPRGEEGVALAREVGDKAILAQQLLWMSLALRDQLDWKRMEAAAEESLALSQELGNTIHIAAGYRQLGRVAMHRGDYSRARACFSEDLTRTRLLGDVEGVAIALGNLADVAIQEEDYPRAQALCAERLALARKMGHQWHTVHTLERLVMVALAQQQAERAVRLFGAVQACRDSTGDAFGVQAWRVATGSPHVDEQSIAPARAILGEDAFEAVLQEGRAMSVEQAIAYALEEGESVR
jgi:predicted ATPase/class 3 adenylate cyclase